MGALEAQELLDGGRDQRWLVPQRSLLVGMVGQREDRAGDERGRRPMTAYQQHDDRRREFVVGQGVGRARLGDESRDDVIHRLSSPSFSQPADELACREHAGLGSPREVR